MSLRAMLWVLEDAPVENHGELAVLYALAERADDDGSCSWPSQDWVAFRARCTDRTVRNHLRALESRGVIRKGDPRFVEHLRPDRRPTVWDLNLSAKRAENSRPENSSGRKIQVERPENLSTTTGKSESNDRKQVSDKPSRHVHEPSRTVHDHSLMDQQFDEWWSHYPKKVAKGQARKAFRSAMKKISFDDLVQATDALARTSRNTEKRFIPNPATWLNGERWADEDIQSASAGGASVVDIRKMLDEIEAEEEVDESIPF